MAWLVKREVNLYQVQRATLTTLTLWEGEQGCKVTPNKDG